ncbi:MAG: glycosyltransferase family 39 protein [Chloroflexi bacterium]|nr:glycosyltransferase family 39 protein [Chloroflexota bacterium]
MADPVRIGLFALALAAVIASSLVLVGPLRLGGTAGLLAVWIIATGQVVLLAQVLSMLQSLDWPGFLLGHLLIAGGVAAWARGRQPADRWLAGREIRAGLRRVAAVASDWDVPAVPFLAIATLITGLISAVQAVWVPPNNWDSLAYHMTRVGYYLQFRSLSHYPTEDWRQVVFPANAEISILWTVAFLRSDRLANTVQLAAWFFAAVSIYGLGRQARLGPSAALLASGAFALLPQSVLQSTTARNDLVVTAFVVASLFFLVHAGQAPRPIASLALAGAAAGLAIGTKFTAVLALPGLVTVFLVLFWRRLDRYILTGLLVGGMAAAALGSYIYVQNWFLYGSVTGTVYQDESEAESQASVPLSQAFVRNLAQTLYGSAFADLSGPLADARAEPLAFPLAQGLGAVGEGVFAALAIRTSVGAADVSQPPFRFVRAPAVSEATSGVGLVGGLMLLVAAGTLLWPGRAPSGGRLLAVAGLSYLVAMSATISWTLWGSGRYVMPACAMAAPLLGLLLRRPGVWAQTLAVVLAAWSGLTGLYVARFNDSKPLSELVGQDRLGWVALNNVLSTEERFFREVEQELGPASTVGVYGDRGLVRGGFKNQLESIFFGGRFSRTLVPLVGADYAERRRLRRPLPQSSEDLLVAYPPAYIAVVSPRPGVEALSRIIPGRCFEVPLVSRKPMVAWELWRCEEQDPRSVLQNGDFRAWSGGPGQFQADDRAPPAGAADGWAATVADEGRLRVSRLEPDGLGGESFRLGMEYRADQPGEAGIVQEVALDRLRGAVLVVDARLRADEVGAAVLWLDDGVTSFHTVNETTDPETLRVTGRVNERATDLRIGLDASGTGRDATVVVRTILAIPR